MDVNCFVFFFLFFVCLFPVFFLLFSCFCSCCFLLFICFGAPKLYAFPICKCYEFLNILLGYPLCLTTTDNITTKHVCKAFLQEYRIRDIRFRALWSKQDPNAKGEDEHERNRKKTGPQRRRETRPRQKYEKITRKK